MAELAILDVDLLAFERGDGAARAAVVDGVRRSLATGFVYTSSDLPVDLLDTAYGLLKEFFALDPASKAAPSPALLSVARCMTGTSTRRLRRKPPPDDARGADHPVS